MKRTRARVMSLIGASVVAAVVTAGLVIPTGSASAQSPAVETARCDGTYRNFITTVQPDQKRLQRFTASVGGPLDSVDVSFTRQFDRVTAPLTVNVRTFDDNTGQPGALVGSADVPAATAPVNTGAQAPPTTVRFAGATALTAGGRYALELVSDGIYNVDLAAGSACGGFDASVNGSPYRPVNNDPIRLVARVQVAAPPATTAVSVRGGGTLSTGDGQRYSISVDARATTDGQASGRFALSGGGPDTTAGSRTITSVSRTATGSTVTGTAGTSSGKRVSFTMTVADGPGGRDRVSVQLGDRTVSGVLINGDITTT